MRLFNLWLRVRGKVGQGNIGMNKGEKGVIQVMFGEVEWE